MDSYRHDGLTFDVLDQGPTRGTPYVAQVHQRLAEVYRHTGRPGPARAAASTIASARSSEWLWLPDISAIT